MGSAVFSWSGYHSVPLAVHNPISRLQTFNFLLQSKGRKKCFLATWGFWAAVPQLATGVDRYLAISAAWYLLFKTHQ